MCAVTGKDMKANCLDKHINRTKKQKAISIN